MGSSRELTSTTTLARQPHGLKSQNSHIHLIEVKYCEDTRFDVQLEASKQQHSELQLFAQHSELQLFAQLCKQLQGAEITFHSILLGVGGNIYTAHTLDQFKKLGIGSQRSETLARKLHAHSVQFAH
eukprot:1155083-Pelagomonas_calceolata.AAC.2